MLVCQLNFPDASTPSSRDTLCTLCTPGRISPDGGRFKITSGEVGRQSRHLARQDEAGADWWLAEQATPQLEVFVTGRKGVGEEAHHNAAIYAFGCRNGEGMSKLFIC